MDIDGSTTLLGILGDPVSHSLSPRMQNAALTEMKLNMCYVPLHVTPADLPAAVAGLKAMQFRGANVTIPHKVAVAALMDSLDETAVRTGAVNTIVNNGGELVGHNTDGVGFIRSLEEKVTLDYSDTPVLIAGAGGAARSVAVALAGKGVPAITILNRTRSRAEELTAILVRDFPGLKVEIATPEDDTGGIINSSKLVINATPLGMEGQLKSLPFRVDRISKEHVVCDIVYTRTQETPLLVAAQQKGAITLGGVGMLLHQGAVAIHLWTGIEPPIVSMRLSIEP